MVVQEAVVKNPAETLDTNMLEANIPKTAYTQALKESASNPTVILHRAPSDTCINNYNGDLLKIWSANLDVQFVSDPHACAKCILSYVTKDERQMG